LKPRPSKHDAVRRRRSDALLNSHLEDHMAN
jgi:hypothetical protein